jgi:acyl transferase domain-containing protein/acyl carrier protein
VAFLLRGTPDAEAARTLFGAEPAFREAVERCAASNPAVARFFRGQGESSSAVVFATLLGLADLFQEWGVAPHTVAGTGPGERVALYLSGVLSLEDALQLPPEPNADDLAALEWNAPERALLLADGTRVEAGEAVGPEAWQRHLGAREADTALAELLEEPGRVLLEPGLDAVHAPDDVIAGLLGELGRLWLSGVEVHWPGLWRHESRRRTPLPTYAFERTRVWAEPKTDWADAFARRADPDLRQDLDHWFRAPSWQRQEVVPGHEAALPAGPWLLLVDEGGLGAGLARALRERTGESVFEVARGDRAQRSGEHFTVRPGHPEDLAQVFETLAAEGTEPAQIVSLWGTDELPQDASPFEHPQEFTALLPLARLATAPSLVVVTAAAEEVTGAEDLHPARAVVRGLLQVLPKEVPGVRCRHLDIVLPRPGQQQRLLDSLLRELGSDEPRIALRGRHRWIETWQRLPLAHREPPLREGGVYLLVGPLDDFALLAADLLSQSGQVRVAVIGESGLPAAEGWAAWVEEHPPEDPVRRRIEALQAIEARGTELLLIDTDPTREAPLRTAVMRVRERFGAVHGVVHAAPERAPEFARSLAEVNLDFYQYRLRLRLGAVLALADLLAEDALDFHILPATLGPLLGGSLTSVDSAADAFLDAFAHHQSRLGRAITSIDWDVFADPSAGDAAPLAIRPEEGREVLRRVLANPGPAQVLVSTADLEARLEASRRALDPVDAQDSIEPGEIRPRPDLENPFVAPRGEAEEEIASLWAEVLELEAVGVEDNFFDLGGNSLLATRLVSRLREHFGIELGLGDFFEEATVARVARTVESQNWARQAPDAELVTVGDDEELGEI